MKTDWGGRPQNKGTPGEVVAREVHGNLIKPYGGKNRSRSLSSSAMLYDLIQFVQGSDSLESDLIPMVYQFGFEN